MHHQRAGTEAHDLVQRVSVRVVWRLVQVLRFAVAFEVLSCSYPLVLIQTWSKRYVSANTQEWLLRWKRVANRSEKKSWGAQHLIKCVDYHTCPGLIYLSKLATRMRTSTCLVTRKVPGSTWSPTICMTEENPCTLSTKRPFQFWGREREQKQIFVISG